MNHKQILLEKISNNSEVVGIIGLGYVGLPLAVNFAEEGGENHRLQEPQIIIRGYL